jgi:hypothetical protein
MGSGTAATVRGNEYLQNTTRNLTAVLDKTAVSGNIYLTPEEVVQADIIFATGVQGAAPGSNIGDSGSELPVETIINNLVTAGIDEDDIPPIYANAPATTFGIVMNSTENIFGLPTFNGFAYPEVIDPMLDTMYLIKNFWHISSESTLNSLTANIFANSTLPEGYSNDPTDFREATVQAKIEAGLIYKGEVD